MSSAGHLTARERFAAMLRAAPVVLAPMEDVSDAPFRRVARLVGATICVTEFVRAEQLIASARKAERKVRLLPDDVPTGIQIYGSDAGLLLEAARIAVGKGPAFLDINCGCWVPKIAKGGAGAGWLRKPDAMVAMARAIVDEFGADLPVTVKTRIGWGPESEMPIIDLARRLEDAGVAALTIHCRTALQGKGGDADWQWARRAREVVQIPVIVNGDIRTADDVVRALAETGCAGAMIGRAAIDHPWIFREATARLAGQPVVPPTNAERIALLRTLLAANVETRGEGQGVAVSRRHAPLLGDLLPRAERARLYRAETTAAVEDELARLVA